jgi:hypothetical protein
MKLWMIPLVIASMGASLATARQAAVASGDKRPTQARKPLGVLIGFKLLQDPTVPAEPSAPSPEAQAEAQPADDEKIIHTNQAEANNPFQTAWIQISGGRVSVRFVQDIIVPRKSGFWRFGENTDSAHAGGSTATEDFFWAAPLGQKPKLAAIKKIDCSSKESFAEVDYIGPDYVASSGFYTSICMHYGEGHAFGVSSLDNLNGSAIGMSTLLGPAAGRQLRRLNREAQSQENEVCGVPGFAGGEGGWTLRHSEGRWHAIAKLSGTGGSVCDREDVDVPLAALPPASLVPFNTLPVPWKAIKAAFPEATDAFASPDGDLLLVFAPKQILFVSAQAGKLQKFHAIEVPFGNPVMAEWALGANVARWNQTLSKLPAPSPVSRSRAPL